MTDERNRIYTDGVNFNAWSRPILLFVAAAVCVAMVGMGLVFIAGIPLSHIAAFAAAGSVAALVGFVIHLVETDN